jgi:hypothetical protein
VGGREGGREGGKRHDVPGLARPERTEAKEKRGKLERDSGEGREGGREGRRERGAAVPVRGR